MPGQTSTREASHVGQAAAQPVHAGVLVVGACRRSPGSAAARTGRRRAISSAALSCMRASSAGVVRLGRQVHRHLGAAAAAQRQRRRCAAHEACPCRGASRSGRACAPRRRRAPPSCSSGRSVVGQLAQRRQAVARREAAAAQVVGDQVGDQQVGRLVARVDAAPPVLGGFAWRALDRMALIASRCMASCRAPRRSSPLRGAPAPLIGGIDRIAPASMRCAAHGAAQRAATDACCGIDTRRGTALIDRSLIASRPRRDGTARCNESGARTPSPPTHHRSPRHAESHQAREPEGRLPRRLRREGLRGREGRAGREGARHLPHRGLRRLDRPRQPAAGHAAAAQGLRDLDPALRPGRHAGRAARLPEARRRGLPGPPELQQPDRASSWPKAARSTPAASRCRRCTATAKAR